MNKYHVGASILLNKIINDKNIKIKAVLIRDVWKSIGKGKKENNLIKAVVKWGSKTGYYFLLGLVVLTIIHFVKIFILEVLFILLIFKKKNYLKSVTRLSIDYDFKIFKISDVNDEKSKKILNNLKPDIILSNNYHQIISTDIINIAKLGSINIHPGKLPLYKGLLPHFWSMVNEESKGGVTLHYMSDKPDEGDIISEGNYKIDKKDSFYYIWSKSAHIGTNLLQKFFKNINSNKKVSKISHKNKKSRFYYFPGKKAFLKFKKNGFYLYKIKDFFK